MDCRYAGIGPLSSSCIRTCSPPKASIRLRAWPAWRTTGTAAGRSTWGQTRIAGLSIPASRSTRCCCRSSAGRTRRGRISSGSVKLQSSVLPRSILPPSYEQTHGQARRIELAADRVIRDKNKASYRLNHWPIWIFVFFIAPGPMTFSLFEHGFNLQMAAWMAAVLIGTGLAGLAGQLPGVEPRPYIIRFTEDRPNPLYRRICYTLAWSEAITFAVLNITGLVYAIVTGVWRLRQIYEVAYFPLAGAIWALGALGQLPRVKRSTKGEGHERRYFYGSVWAVCIAQPILWLMWKVLPRTRSAEAIKLLIFVGILLWVGNMARRGLLPRTRPIVPGELAVSDS